MAFLKWAGGKRWLAPYLKNILGRVDQYLEPFLGSGAVFFELAPSKAILSDSNSILIDAFDAVKTEPHRLLRVLRGWPVSAEMFGRIRDSKPRSKVGKAARFIYLNRTAFNGLYRVNQRGNFNVPFGCKVGTTSCDEAAVLRAAEMLERATFKCEDFASLIEKSKPNTLIYADPPYVLPLRTGYDRYNAHKFRWEDQQRLAKQAGAAVGKGCQVIVSNALSSDISKLYKRREFAFFQVERSSRMAADPSHRGRFAELLIVSKNLPNSVMLGFRCAFSQI